MTTGSMNGTYLPVKGKRFENDDKSNVARTTLATALVLCLNGAPKTHQIIDFAGNNHTIEQIEEEVERFAFVGKYLNTLPILHVISEAVMPEYEISKDIDFVQPFKTNSRKVKIRRVQFRG